MKNQPTVQVCVGSITVAVCLAGTRGPLNPSTTSSPAGLTAVTDSQGRSHTDSYLSTFENFPGVESARQLVSDILPIARGRYK